MTNAPSKNSNSAMFFTDREKVFNGGVSGTLPVMRPSLLRQPQGDNDQRSKDYLGNTDRFSAPLFTLVAHRQGEISRAGQ